MNGGKDDPTAPYGPTTAPVDPGAPPADLYDPPSYTPDPTAPSPTTPPASNAPSGAPSNWESILAGLAPFLQGGNTANSNAAQVAAAADPFASQRAQYQKQLQGLMTDPNSFQVDPGTQYAIDAANNATTRSANSMGVSRGGSVLAGISANTVGLSEADYNTRIQQLTALSGAAPGNPGAAAAAIATGQQNQNSNIAGAINSGTQLISALTASGIPQSIISQISGMLNPGGSTGGSPGATDGGGTADPNNPNTTGDGSGTSPLAGGDNPPITPPDQTGVMPPGGFGVNAPDPTSTDPGANAGSTPDYTAPQPDFNDPGFWGTGDGG
jgi:hypothetical protein